MTAASPPMLDPLKVAKSQRQMIICFAIVIAVAVATPVLLLLLREMRPDTDPESTLNGMVPIYFGIQLVATIAYMLAAFQLIREIGWSALNQIAFVFICIISMGCGLLLFVSLILINMEANKILRAHDVRIGLLGASRAEIERLREAQDG